MEQIEAIVVGARSILGASLSARSDVEARDDVRVMVEAMAIVEAAYLKLVSDLDSRRGAVPYARAGKVAETFLRGMNLNRGQAARDVAAARAVEGPLPEVGAALAAGEITRGHVDVAVRTLQRVPTQFAGAMPVVDEFLADQARSQGPQALDVIAKELLQRLDPEGTDRFDPEAHLRRGLTLTDCSDGMLLIRGQVAGVQAAWIRAQVDAMSKPEPAQADEQGVLVPDLRTKAQRQADALADLCRRGPSDVVAPAQITIIADLDQASAAAAGDHDAPVGLADDVSTGRPPSSRALSQHLCDAILRSFNRGSDAGLNLGFAQRLATDRQRAVLIARDRGCIVPGCPARAGTCDAHHVRWWSEGGATDIDNLALLCGRHHAEVHLGIWRLQLRDRLPWVVPPRYYDPDQRPRRNTLHEQARKLATQLRLEFHDPP